MNALHLATSKRADRVRQMFTDIAPTYDRLNHLLSGNRDKAWRRVAVTMLQPQPRERLVDLCGGTGDLALECLRQQPQARVVVADFSHTMLRLAQAKLPRATHAHTADALRLPYTDAAFDAVTVGFGVRNFEDPARGLREIRRVLKPGGKLLVLEFFKPSSRVMALVFGRLFRWMLPLVGRVVSGHSFAYLYLPESVGEFVTLREFEALLNRANFAVEATRSLDGGIACAIVAVAA